MLKQRKCRAQLNLIKLTQEASNTRASFIDKYGKYNWAWVEVAPYRTGVEVCILFTRNAPERCEDILLKKKLL